MIHAQKPTRAVDPASDPLTTSEVKEHLRVDHTDEDSLIATYTAAALAYLDGYSGVLGRCLITQTWQQKFSDFPSGYKLALPFPDVQSVSVAYVDTNGDPQTLSASNYELAEGDLGAYLRLADGAVWPSTDEVTDAVTVTMVCGYGDAADVPAPIKAAMLLHIGTLYENRETLSERVSPNMAFESLIAPYRRVL